MPMPRVGDSSPAFQLSDQNGNTVSLAQFAGRNVVLYFYPKDDTPGCTKEACHFRDQHPALEQLDAVVLGVSPDDVKSHLKFAGKYGLPFPLLADAGHQVAEQYGVWGEKSLYGRKFMGINRATFLIGPSGTVRHAWPKVKVENHVNEVLEVLQGRASEERPASEMNETPAAESPAPGGEEQTVGEAAAELLESAEQPTAAPRAKKSGARKAAGKKAAAKKGGAAKKAAGKKPAAKKGATAKKGAAGNKAAAKKGGAAKKAAGKKTAAKKGAAKKGAAKKGAAGKTAAAKKGGAAKKGARKSTRR